MIRMAIKSLLGHKLRMFLTAFSIVLGVSFVAGSYIFTDSMASTFNNLFSDVYTSIDVIVQPDDDGFSEDNAAFDVSVEETLRSIAEVQDIEGGIAGDTKIILQDGTVAGAPGAPTFAFSWTVNPALNPLNIKEGNGRAPERAGEVIIDANTVQQNDLLVGDTVLVQPPTGRPQEFTLVGKASFGDTDSLAGASLAAFEIIQAQEFFGLQGRFSEINITATSGTTPEQLKTLVEAKLPAGTKAVTGNQEQEKQVAEINEGLGFISTFLLAFAGVSVFVGSFIIQNTFRIVVSQRSKELALLRAIGATRSQIIRMVVYEALIVAVLASALGILAGIGVSNGLRAALNAAGVGLPGGNLTLEPRTIYVSLAVGIIVTLVAAIVPAIKASRVSPVEAMRDSEGTTAKKSLRSRALSGGIVTAIGGAALAFGLFGDIKNPVYFVGAGAAIVFIGISILAPLLSGIVATLIGSALNLYYGIVGRIGMKNIKQSPRRTASTAAALMIGVSLVVLASILTSSAKATVDEVIVNNFPGDIIVTNSDQSGDPEDLIFSPTVADELEQLDELSIVSRINSVSVRIGTKIEDVTVVDPTTITSVYNAQPSDGTFDGLLDADTVYVLDSTLQEIDKNVGDVLDVEYATTGLSQLRIAGTFEESPRASYIISETTRSENFSDTSDMQLIANVANGVSLEDGKAAINKVLENYPTVSASDKSELVAEARKQIDQGLGILTALIGLAVLIAIIGIINTLTLSVSERTREIGMLRAIGMTRRQVRRMIRVEAIIIAVFGAILGIAMGIFFGWAMLRALEDSGLTAFSIPTGQVLFYLALSVIAGVIAAIIPSYRASRMSILEAIDYE